MTTRVTGQPFDWRAGGGRHIEDRFARIAAGHTVDVRCDVCGASMMLTHHWRDEDGDGGGALECTACDQSHGLYGPDRDPSKFPLGTHFCTVMSLPPDRAAMADWMAGARRALGWEE